MTLVDDGLWTLVDISGSGRGRKWTLVDGGAKISFPENLSQKTRSWRIVVRKFFIRIVAQTDGMACGSKSSATVPVVIDAYPPTFECSRMQEAGSRPVGEKRRK